ncbi:hypothetical protein TSUD_206710 [Trifolium subterraneum]|uniref:Uncharacterized protein n=1 Tax=Trifolium subterraneum TaxID=3900 RepID=A0A2Z6NNK4_TRISU|nr:hypothetical protein TSUD_206710 [Trifolium subterraneum]
MWGELYCPHRLLISVFLLFGHDLLFLLVMLSRLRYIVTLQFYCPLSIRLKGTLPFASAINYSYLYARVIYHEIESSGKRSYDTAFWLTIYQCNHKLFIF